MESFNKSVCHWVIRCGASTLRAQELHQFSPQYRLKLATTISSGCWWSAKPWYPPTHKCFGNSLCCDVHYRNGFWPSSESVDAGEDVCVTVRRRKRPHNVEMNLVKSNVRCCKSGEWGDCMSLHLWPLALKTGSSPSPDISIDARPHNIWQLGGVVSLVSLDGTVSVVSRTLLDGN